MFFENEHFCAELLLVNRFTTEEHTYHIKARPFSALALRLRGTAEFRFSDGTSLTSREGDVLYLPHGLSYDAVYTDMEVLAFHFHDNSEGATAENYTPRTPQVLRLFEEAEALWECGTPDARMEAHALFYRIAAELSREARPAPELASFLNAVAFLEQEYANPDLDIPSVCARAGLSESAFRRNFTARYGKPPIKYLTELRLGAAQKHLVATRDSVEAVALACGFRDVKYFSRVCRRYFGCTPRELRTL